LNILHHSGLIATANMVVPSPLPRYWVPWVVLLSVVTQCDGLNVTYERLWGVRGGTEFATSTAYLISIILIGISGFGLAVFTVIFTSVNCCCRCCLTSARCGYCHKCRRRGHKAHSEKRYRFIATTMVVMLAISTTAILLALFGFASALYALSPIISIVSELTSIAAV
jgi:hypothetical protein